MKRSLLITVLVVVAGPSGCAKKETAPAPGAGTMTAGMAAPGDRAPAQPPAPGATAADLCPGGGRPDQAITHDAYEVKITAPAQGAANQEAKAEITVVPRGEYKYNEKYDSALEMKPAPAGTTLPRPKLDNAAAAERSVKGLRFVVAYTPTTPGKRALVGELDFSVCTPKACITEQKCVAWETTVP